MPDSFKRNPDGVMSQDLNLLLNGIQKFILDDDQKKIDGSRQERIMNK